MLGIFALANLALTDGAAATVAGLCAKLTSGVCAGWHFNAITDAAGCETIFNSMALTDGDDTDTNANTIGCRLHWANMATDNATALNCRYAGITGAGQCGNYTVALDNACKGIVGACSADPQSLFPYQDVAQCMDTTTGLGGKIGFWGSNTGPSAALEDTIECRVYHATVGKATAPDSAHCGHVGPTGGDGWCNGGAATNAEHYCRTAQSHCVDTRMQYNNQAECEASFAAFPAANLTAANANTQGCRQYHINVAAASTVPADSVHCTHGGPSGGTQCGTSYEAWQSLANIPACLAIQPDLAGGVNGAFNNWASADVQTVVPDGTGINVATNYTVGMAGDNVMCRIYHLTVATQLPDQHCEHGTILASACFDMQPPMVFAACRMAMTGCPSAFADVSECVGNYSALLASPGNATNPAGEDTLACRVFAAATALALKKNGADATAVCGSVGEEVGPLCMAPPPTPEMPAPTTAQSNACSVVASLVAVLLPFVM